VNEVGRGGDGGGKGPERVLWELGARGPVALALRVRGKEDEDDGRHAGSTLRGESARITRGSNPLDRGEDLTGMLGDE
jgi:hypothetical protein